MADIFNGKDVKVYYNDDTGNRAVITGGNIQINELAAYPSFSMEPKYRRSKHIMMNIAMPSKDRKP